MTTKWDLEIARWLPAQHACLLKSWLSHSTREKAKRGNKQVENKEEQKETEKDGFFDY